jgi:hypothetical protein
MAYKTIQTQTLVVAKTDLRADLIHNVASSSAFGVWEHEICDVNKT